MLDDWFNLIECFKFFRSFLTIFLSKCSDFVALVMQFNSFQIEDRCLTHHPRDLKNIKTRCLRVTHVFYVILISNFVFMYIS